MKSTKEHSPTHSYRRRYKLFEFMFLLPGEMEEESPGERTLLMVFVIVLWKVD